MSSFALDFMAGGDEFWHWWRNQDATLRLVLTAWATTLGGGFLIWTAPRFGADIAVVYFAYLLGVGVEFFLVRKDGPFVRTGMGRAMRKEGTFLVLLVVVLAVPAFVSLAVGLPGLLDSLAASFQKGPSAFLFAGLVSTVTGFQAASYYD